MLQQKKTNKYIGITFQATFFFYKFVFDFISTVKTEIPLVRSLPNNVSTKGKLKHFPELNLTKHKQVYYTRQ